jgi:hypothetical protein
MYFLEALRTSARAAQPMSCLMARRQRSVFSRLLPLDAVRSKLKPAILYIERNPNLVRSFTAFPYIVTSL